MEKVETKKRGCASITQKIIKLFSKIMENKIIVDNADFMLFDGALWVKVSNKVTNNVTTEQPTQVTENKPEPAPVVADDSQPAKNPAKAEKKTAKKAVKQPEPEEETGEEITDILVADWPTLVPNTLLIMKVLDQGAFPFPQEITNVNVVGYEEDGSLHVTPISTVEGFEDGLFIEPTDAEFISLNYAPVHAF